MRRIFANRFEEKVYKHFFDIDGLIVIILSNIKALNNSVKSLYNFENNNNEESYLTKFFVDKVILNPINYEKFIVDTLSQKLKIDKEDLQKENIAFNSLYILKNSLVKLSSVTGVPFKYIFPSFVTETVAFFCSLEIPLLISGTVIELSFDWKVGATTIIIINRTKKISVNGVILISVKRASFPLLVFIPIFLCRLRQYFYRNLLSFYNEMFALLGVVDSSLESTKLKNNNLINWKSSSYLFTIDWKEL